MSNDFIHELSLDSVESNITVPYTPQEYGVAEMSNRIIVNDANPIIMWANFPKSFWV